MPTQENWRVEGIRGEIAFPQREGVFLSALGIKKVVSWEECKTISQQKPPFLPDCHGPDRAEKEKQYFFIFLARQAICKHEKFVEEALMATMRAIMKSR